MGLVIEISDAAIDGSHSSLTLLELREYWGFYLVEVLETKTGVEDGATCDVEIFLSKWYKNVLANSQNFSKNHLLKAKALGFNHDSLVEVRAARSHRGPHLFKRRVVIFLATANTTEHCEYLFKWSLGPR